MSITQLIYTSQPFGFDDAILNGILASSRRNNPGSGITGCLICRHDMYLQLLEGPDAAIGDLYARLKVDNRHLALHQLSIATVHERVFPDWAMRDDPAQSWLWPPEAVAGGALFQASPQSLRAVFARVAA
jgi:Sensors of blue-light using FAD